MQRTSYCLSYSSCNSVEENILLNMCEGHSFHVRYRMEASCLELALEGERLCKAGDCRAGVSFFEAAVQVGTEDLKTLSAIYSQLGNAYFYLHEYTKALEYHHHDLTLARTIGDQLGEAKASGNLGNTLKVLGNYEEAIVRCQRHLDISRELRDKVGEARALYNLGNVYHSKGKSVACAGTHDPGEFPDDVKAALRKAADYYEENLTIVTELGDRAAQGRAYGNLGNTHYLLGNFRSAVTAHEQRLLIAKEFGDRAAERRAYSNLGNAYIFLGEFETAAEYYKKTLQLARQLTDRAVEAQACYSLGNTYTLLQDYEKAIDYHLKHLAIAEELNDRIGEGRACWSLGNAYTALGNHEQAMHYAEKHLDISREVGDKTGELTAKLNLSDLQMVLGLSFSTNSSMMTENQILDHSVNGARPRVGRRHSMENMELMKLTPEKNSPDVPGDEGFFDLLSRFQSNRMDDQRYCFQDRNRLAVTASSAPSRTLKKSFSTSMVSPHTDEFLDLLASSQSRRLDDQRANASDLPGLRLNQCNSQSVLGRLMASSNSEPDDDFFDILIKYQGSRLDDQRCAPPPINTKGPTVPDEDFFSLILRSQGKRMDEQRVFLPSDLKRANSN
ncbi:G-protein-signaling modulator 2 isoform X5 [Zootoca vivipara]|uniref:G-protein-signaling modulator 2 isoform X5 n=1 Tax=Zootoca vivipara TaxID=8524 RepID=UPI0015901797|nr:G-protein-signaling modulator 2 isoform X5 [Zootoca vivipara]